MSIELNCKDGYNIEIEKKEDRINILLVENEAFGERILVGAEEREEFLTPWINMLIRHKKETGIKGTMDLARKLEHIADVYSSLDDMDARPDISTDDYDLYPVVMFGKVVDREKSVESVEKGGEDDCR